MTGAKTRVEHGDCNVIRFSLSAGNQLENWLLWGLDCLLLGESQIGKVMVWNPQIAYSTWLPIRLLLHPSCLL